MNINFRNFIYYKSKGAQPVSMDLKNIQYTAHYPYKVSWKADGTKLMIAILDENEIFGCDRDFAVYPLAGKISFFKRLFAPESAGTSQQQTKNLTNTILDGELVIDNITTTVILLFKTISKKLNCLLFPRTQI